MKVLLQISLCMIVLTISILSFAEKVKIYQSPDGKLIARISSADTKCAESQVEVRKPNGVLIVSQDYSSSDCEHGLVIERAAWTPDSQFFVYSAYSSGGHQSWLSPTFFYERSINRISNIAEYLPAIANTQFSLSAPDVITINIWTPLSTERNLEKSIILPITFRLSDIRKGGKKRKEFLGE